MTIRDRELLEIMGSAHEAWRMNADMATRLTAAAAILDMARQNGMDAASVTYSVESVERMLTTHNVHHVFDLENRRWVLNVIPKTDNNQGNLL